MCFRECHSSCREVEDVSAVVDLRCEHEWLADHWLIYVGAGKLREEASRMQPLPRPLATRFGMDTGGDVSVAPVERELQPSTMATVANFRATPAQSGLSTNRRIGDGRMGWYHGFCVAFGRGFSLVNG